MSSSSSTTICRSLSLPRYLKRESCEVEDLLLTRLPPSNYLIDDNTDNDTAPAGNVVIKRYFHHHPLILSTYSKEKMDECCICEIYLTRGTPVYKCISKCDNMIFHKLCAEEMDDDDTAQAAGNPHVAIKRYFHNHPLILSTYLKQNVDKKDECEMCHIYFTWGTRVYKCIDTECTRYPGDTIFHKLCAELPRRITNLLHPEHSLHLFYHYLYADRKCVKCEVEHFQLGYECVICESEFFLDAKCAFQDVPISVAFSSSSLSRSLSFPLDRKQNSSPIRFSDPRNLPTNVSSLVISSFPKFQIQKKSEIRHISHKKHPLILMTYFQQFESDDCIICDAKFLPDDLVYGCHECTFFLHKSCAEIVYPLSLRTTLHPAHLLELTFLTKKFFRIETCSVCDKDLSDRIGYNCKALCEYNLCNECAFTHIFEDHKEHKYQIWKEIIFTCDACGVTENKQRHSSACTGCRLQVHINCSNLFPPTVKQTRHPHTLHLTYFFECGDDFAGMMCKICYNKINNVYCIYQCTICTTYITHVTCSTSKDIVEKDQIMPSSVDIVEKDQIVPSSIEGRQVKHFSHPHDLIYTSTETDHVMICDACVRPIISSSSVPFYKCADNRCSFCLHKQCFELPRQLQHPLHAHRLTLILPSDKKYCQLRLFLVQCYGCDIRCNGFLYGCEECKFWMDVRCGLLSYELKHDSHPCTLSLVDYNLVRDQGIVDKAAKCSACDCKCESHSLCKYTCERCNFHLDLGCALLPKTVPHNCPKYNWEPNHPLKLMYGAIKDDSGIYFCDMCEERRGENDWFYRCEDCNWSNHPHCVLRKIQLKYGKLYQLGGRGQDDHMLVKISEWRHDKHIHYLCLKCDKPCKDSAFFCGISFHVKCVYGVQEIVDDKRLTCRAFLNGIQEIHGKEDDNIRLVRAFLIEIGLTHRKLNEYDIDLAAVYPCYDEFRCILIEGDDDIVCAVRVFLNGFQRKKSKGDDDILDVVRVFINKFRKILGEDGDGDRDDNNDEDDDGDDDDDEDDDNDEDEDDDES